MKTRIGFFLFGAIFSDFLAGFLAWIAAWKIRPMTDLIPFLHTFFDPRFIPPFDFLFSVAVFSATGLVAVSAIFGLYHFEKKFDFSRVAPRIFAAAIFWGMAIISFFAVFFREVIFSRMMLFQAVFFAAVLAIFFRFLLDFFSKKYFPKTKIALFGGEKSRDKILKILQHSPDFSVEISAEALEKINPKNISELWICEKLSEKSEKIVRDFCAKNHLEIRFRAADFRDFAKIEIDFFGGVGFLKFRAANLSGGDAILKRIFDLLGASFLIVFLSPILVILAIGVKLSSRGNIFYISRRVGQNGKLFPMFKFRSMIENAEKLKKNLAAKNHRDGPFFKIKNDPRITKFGKFLRRFSLDELPQLFNVVRGEMSLVGPRPHFPDEIEKFPPEFLRILSVPPGISGLAQISGRSDLRFADEIRLDLFYLENWNFWLDLKIILKTIFVVLRGNGAD